MDKIIKFVKQFDTVIISLATVFCSAVLGNYISLGAKITLYTASHTLKSLLMFLIPILIFPFIVNSTAQMKEKGAYLVFIILFLVFVSNFFSICFAYGLSSQIIPFLNIPTNVSCQQTCVTSSNDFSMVKKTLKDPPYYEQNHHRRCGRAI